MIKTKFYRYDTTPDLEAQKSKNDSNYADGLREPILGSFP